jgi:hypothetical protein
MTNTTNNSGFKVVIPSQKGTYEFKKLGSLEQVKDVLFFMGFNRNEIENALFIELNVNETADLIAEYGKAWDNY